MMLFLVLIEAVIIALSLSNLSFSGANAQRVCECKRTSQKKEVEKLANEPDSPQCSYNSPVVSEIFDSDHKSTETQELNAVSPPVSDIFDSVPDTCRLRHELQKLQDKYDETLDELVDTKYKLQRRTYNQRELLKQRDELERELDEQDTEIADMKKDYELNIFFLEH